MKYIVPLIIIATISVAFFKKISVYDSFIDGAKESARLIVSLLPYLTSVFVLIEVFEVSGLNIFLSKYLGYLISFFGIPSELSELIIIRPLSGSGSLCIVENIFTKYGADSYIGRCASVVSGSNDTIFYIVAVYMSGCKGKKAPLAIPIALVSSFFSVIISCFICRFI